MDQKSQNIRESLEIMFALFLVMMLCVGLGTLTVSAVKYLTHGKITTKGRILSYSSSFVRDCIKLSQTTQGESSIVRYCVYRDIKNVPELGTKVEVIYHKNYFVTRNEITIVPIRD